MVVPVALRHVTASSSTHTDSAKRLLTNIINVRSIAAHFTPKIDNWSATHDVVSITPEQVCERLGNHKHNNLLVLSLLVGN